MGNYRPISILPTPIKVYENIFQNLLQGFVDNYETIISNLPTDYLIILVVKPSHTRTDVLTYLPSTVSKYSTCMGEWGLNHAVSINQ